MPYSDYTNDLSVRGVLNGIKKIKRQVVIKDTYDGRLRSSGAIRFIRDVGAVFDIEYHNYDVTLATRLYGDYGKKTRKYYYFFF